MYSEYLRNKTRGILLIAIIFFSDQSFAQDTLVKLTGKVIDRETQDPVIASITYEKLPYADDMGIAFSQPNGDYLFYTIKNASYSLDVEAEGYQKNKSEIKITDQDNDQVEKHIIKLSPLRDEPPPPPEEEHKIIRLENLIFATGKANITPSSYEELNTIVKMMEERPDIKIQLEGHTDFAGNPKANMQLSRDRVEAVKDYLVDQGIKKKRIMLKAFGGEQPITRDRSPEGRRKNRRVEVRILK